MIFAAGPILWLVAALLLVRLLRRREERALSNGAALWAGALVAAAILLFRPHEELIGGQDAAAYVNAAQAIAQHGSFTYVDPLLSRVPPKTRPDFLYRHRTATQTKDGCLWVKDIDQARVGVHFQPAYPLLMAVFPAIGLPFGAWYVAPFFAILAGLALARLSRLLMDQPAAGLLTFLFYVSNPLLIWHARYARPEVIASFFFFGGLTLVLSAWKDTTGRSQRDLALGALAIGLAPFFHITAWMLALPTALVVAAIILAGRRDFLVYPCVASAGLLVFVLQSLYVTDPYNLGRRIQALWPAENVLVALSAIVAASAIVVVLFGRRRTDAAPLRDWPRWAGLMAGAFLILLFAGLYAWLPTPEDRPRLTRQIYHYVYRTDLPVVVSMLSRPIAALGLLGLFALAAGRQRTRERLAFLACVVPATLMIGVMYDFFMTRYMLTALIPLLALALTALLVNLPLRHRPAWLTPVSAALLVLLQVQGRTTWITTTAYKGLTDYFGQIAAVVKKENGILLCEYSRFAAPFEHYYGIPTLSLDNETRSDYTAALKAWRCIMKESGRPAFFVTPFQPPRAERLSFLPQCRAALTSERLREEQFRPPNRREDLRIDLTLYTMRQGGTATSCENPRPVVYTPDESNMGLRNFAGIREKAWEIETTSVESGRPLRILRDDFDEPAGNRLLLFVHEPESDVSSLSVSGDGVPPAHDIQVIPLDDEWTLLQVPLVLRPDWREVTLVATNPVLISDIKLASSNNVSSWTGATRPGTTVALKPMKARWTRGSSAMLMPLPDGESLFLLFAKAPEAGDSGLTTVALYSYATNSTPRQFLQDRWTWEAWPVNVERSAGQKWLKLGVSPTWDPQERKMPSDLGVLVGRAAVIERH